MKKAYDDFIASGIHRLPSEILREIFVLCLPSHMYRERDSKEAPLLPTWICRRWRQIALDTPELWCSLSIALDNKVMDPEQSLFFYHHWLSNTKSYPLSLEVNVCSPGRIPATAFSKPYIARCTELNINFGEAVELEPLLEDVPMLILLELFGELDTIAQPISIVQPQPRLRGLIIRSPVFGVDILSMFNPGWTNLTHLSVTLVVFDWSDEVDHDIFSALLLSCTNLENFSFSPFCLTHHRPVSLTHTKLHTLEIHKLYKRGPIQMGILVFPNLRNLDVLLDVDDGIIPFTALGITEDMTIDEDLPMATDEGNTQQTSIVPAQRRRCDIVVEPSLITGTLLTFLDLGWSSLTHLEINTVDNEVAFLALLQRCPNLEDFSIHLLAAVGHGAPPPDPFTHHRLHSLSINSQTQWYKATLDLMTLPSLRHLSMEFLYPLHWPHKEFNNFLSRSCCPIETLYIEGAYEFIDEEWLEFSALLPTLKRFELETENWAYAWAR